MPTPEKPTTDASGDTQPVDAFAAYNRRAAEESSLKPTTIPAPISGSPPLAPDTTPPVSPSSTQPPLSIPPNDATVVIKGNVTEPAPAAAPPGSSPPPIVPSN